MKFMFFNFNIAKRYNFFIRFLYGEIFFYLYNTLLFSVKLVFCSIFIASSLLIPLIIQQLSSPLMLKMVLLLRLIDINMSWHQLKIYFFLPQTTQFDESIILALFVFTTFGFLFSLFFLHFKQ